MFGWLRADAAFASRWKRLSAWRSCANIVREELEGNEAAKLGVLGLIDDSHPATAQFLEDPIVRDGLPNHRVKS